MCLWAFLGYLQTQTPRENSSLLLSSSAVVTLPKSREEVLSQASLWIRSHFARAEAALLIPFPKHADGSLWGANPCCVPIVTRPGAKTESLRPVASQTEAADVTLGAMA